MKRPTLDGCKEFSESLGAALQQARKRKKLSQVAVAKQSGMTRNSILGIEAGRHSVTPWNLKQICRAMGCSIISILARAEQIQRGEKPLPEAAGPH